MEHPLRTRIEAKKDYYQHKACDLHRRGTAYLAAAVIANMFGHGVLTFTSLVCICVNFRNRQKAQEAYTKLCELDEEEDLVSLEEKYAKIEQTYS